MAGIIDLGEVVVPRRRRGRTASADEQIASEDTQSLANRAIDEFHNMAHTSDLGASLDRVAEEGGIAPAERGSSLPPARRASADDTIHAEPESKPDEDRVIDFNPPVDAVAGREKDIAENVREHPRATAESAVVEPEAHEETRSPADQPLPDVERREEQAQTTAAHVPSAAENNAATAARDAQRIAIYNQDRDLLAEGQRRRKIGAGIQGGLRGLSAILGIVGAAKQDPALTAVGALAGGASNLVDPERKMREVQESIGFKQNAEDRMRADELAAQQSEDRRLGREIQARHEDVYEQGVREQQELHRNQARLREEENRRSGAELARRFTAGTPEAQLGQAVLDSALSEYEARTGRPRSDWADAVARVANVGAEPMQAVIDQISEFARAGRPRRAGGGAARPTTTPESRAQLVTDYSAATGRPAVSVNATFPDTREGNEQLRRELATIARPQRGHGATAAPGEEAPIDARTMEHFGKAFGPVFLSNASLNSIDRRLRGLSDAQLVAMLASRASAQAAGLSGTRQAIYGLINKYYSDISGAAVSDGEAERYQSEIGADRAVDPRAFLNWLHDRQAKTSAEMGTIGATYGSAYRDEFLRRFHAQRAAERAARQAPQGGQP